MDSQSEKLLKAFDAAPSGTTLPLAAIGPVEETAATRTTTGGTGLAAPGQFVR